MLPKPTPTISLCMIVRNEEKRLARCLESVRGLVDEMIIVDTGSRDRTIEIARSFGASVSFFSWVDDFSAARNESLRHATCDWILYLDADERLNCMGEEDCLRKAASNPQADAFSAVIRNFKSTREKVDFDITYNIRLFRNYRGIRFVNEVHERVEPFLAQARARIVRSGFAIDHFAYDGTEEEMERRLRRNLSLSLKHLRRSPGDAYGLYYLGMTYLSMEKLEESRQALEKALETENPGVPLRAIILNLLSYVHLCREEYGQALERAHLSLAAVADQSTAHLVAGLACFRMERYADALPHLLRAYRSSRIPPEMRQTQLSQEYDFVDRMELTKALAISFARTSRYEEAISLFHSYISEREPEADILRRLGICYLNIRDHERAIGFLKEAEKQGVSRREHSLPMAYALVQVNDLAGAEDYLGSVEPENDTDARTAAELKRVVEGSRKRSDAWSEASRPAVSLCMIVKNEEKHLADCLESVRSLVDEIVIVDTGSEDRTVEIAKSFGARVHAFSWRDDFSAARNESLRHATGEWILCLDADERLHCLGATDCLRSAASVQSADGYSIPIIDSRSDSDEMDSCIAYATRMFRRYPGIRFEGRAHETVDRFLREAGANVIRGSFVIEHLGYAVDQSAMERKYLRNLTLLQKGLEESPRDAFSLYQAGLTLLGLKRVEECRDVLDRALLLEGTDPCLKAMTLNALAYCDLKGRGFSSALRKAEESLSLIPNQNTAKLIAGLSNYHLGRYESALPHLLEAQQFIDSPPEQRRTSIHYEDTIEKDELLKAVAICHAEAHKFAQALAFFERLLEHKGEDADLLGRLGACCLNVEDFPSAIRYLERAAQLGADHASLALPMAFACFQLMDWDRACRLFLEAEPSSLQDVSISMRLLGLMAIREEYSHKFLDTWLRKKSIVQRASWEQAAQLAMNLAVSCRARPLAELLELLNLDGEEAKPLLCTIIDIHFRQDRITDLCDLLENLPARREDNPVILEALGIARIKAGDYRGALDVHLSLHRLFPDNDEISRRLAGLYVKTGCMESALAHLARK